MEISLKAIAAFFVERASDLRRITYATRGDLEVEDVENEAYLVVADLGNEQGRTLDLSDAVDQDSVLGALYARVVKFAEKHFRFAVRLESDSDDDTNPEGVSLARTLEAPSASDPAVEYQLRQEATDPMEDAILRSYSEATAYAILLDRHDTPQRLAEHINLALYTLQDRIRSAVRKVRSEPSLFDGVDKIARDFCPYVRICKFSRPNPARQRGAGSGRLFE